MVLMSTAAATGHHHAHWHVCEVEERSTRPICARDWTVFYGALPWYAQACVPRHLPPARGDLSILSTASCVESQCILQSVFALQYCTVKRREKKRVPRRVHAQVLLWQPPKSTEEARATAPSGLSLMSPLRHTPIMSATGNTNLLRSA